jgi:ParB family chromosome partitioning protein
MQQEGCGIMTGKRSALGKGLGALIPDIDVTPLKDSIMEIDINEIEQNLVQPRKKFDEEKLQQLADSIKEHGIVQPVIVRKEGDYYKLIAGERRWRAARMAGLKTIPAITREFTEREMMEISLIENIQREDLNPIEEAEAYSLLMTEFNLTQEEISKRVGKSRSAVANILRLLNLDGRVRGYVTDGLLSEGHARAIISVTNMDLQYEAAKKIIDDGLNVRQTEKLVKSMLNGRVKKPVKRAEPFIIDIQERLTNHLGTKVNINHGRKRGKIEIEYYSPEDLERILDILKV